MRQMILQFCNVADGRLAEQGDYLAGLPGRLGEALLGYRRYDLSRVQFPPPTSIRQPYAHLMAYELEGADLDTAMLREAIVDDPVRRGLLREHEDYRYEIKTWKMPSPRRADPADPDHLMVVLANYVPDMEAEWGEWYDTVHAKEILEIEDLDAYSRGILHPDQITPLLATRSNGLILHHYHTRDFAANVAEFAARGLGTSNTGIRWTSRSPAALLNRTTHGFDGTSVRWSRG